MLTGTKGKDRETADLVAQLARNDKLTTELARTQADSVEARALVERIEREMSRAHEDLRTLL